MKVRSEIRWQINFTPIPPLSHEILSQLNGPVYCLGGGLQKEA
jgi:hypothetical protein